MAPYREAIVSIAGASGFVGRALTTHLVAGGERVVGLSRSGQGAPGAELVAVDIGDEDAVADALAGSDVAYYLVHSLDRGPGFRATDRELAETFGRAAARAEVARIVYLGGLGAAPDSEHLASRQEVGTALGASGVPVVELRAAVVLGAGSISFEMLRSLTERLPMMVCPRWVRTRIQPIGLADLVTYLDHARTVPPGVYEIGGAEVTTYQDLINTYAAVRGLRRRAIVDIPLLTPHLSSYWVDLVTPVDRAVSHALIESLVTEVVVTDPEPTRRAFAIEPVGVADAIAQALDAQEAAIADGLLDASPSTSRPVEGVHHVVVDVNVTGDGDAVAGDLTTIGGRLGWYGATVGWAARIALGRLLGERLRTRRADALVAGALVDWWRVERVAPGELVLRGVGWKPGEAWLGYRVVDGRLRQVAAFRPKGVLGFLYWTALVPVHRIAFVRMAQRRLTPPARSAGRASADRARADAT